MGEGVIFCTSIWWNQLTKQTKKDIKINPWLSALYLKEVNKKLKESL